MAGRPTKLCPQIADTILSAVRAGNYIETAAALAGINKTTLYLWLKKGAREPNGPFGKFSDELETALAASEARDVAIIGEAAEGQWQAAAWRLERKFPERWGRRDRVDLTVKRLEEEVRSLSDDDVLARLGYASDAEAHPAPGGDPARPAPGE